LRVFGNGGDSLELVDAGWVRLGRFNGFDTLANSVGNATVIASVGLVSEDLSSFISGGSGNDVIDTGNGNDTIDGSNGNDIIAAFGGQDSIQGGNDADIIDGGDGADTLSGGDGNDTLDGGLGNDSMAGGAGNDVFIVNSAGDVVRDTAGTDTILLRAASINLAFVNVENVFGDLAGQAFSITGNNAATNLVGGSLNDSIYALQSTDTVYGLDGNDRLDGGSENDLIDGGNGSDTIIGGTGDDTVVSGLGNDSLNGGSGADHFIFNTALGTANVDRIQSYNVTDDTILLDDAIFTALGSPGALAAGAFKAGAAATDADDRIIYNATTGALFYDQDGNGATAAVQFATLTSITGTITHADFLII
jgi:Ca2+-binding RTX toxin-like protein